MTAPQPDGPLSDGALRGGVVDGDPRLPWRAGPLLGQFARAGILTSADVRVAERLGDLTAEPDETVRLAAALAVRAVREGSVCVDLRDASTLPTEDAADGPDVTDDAYDARGEPSRAAVHGPDAVPGAALPWPDLDAWTSAVRRSPMVAEGSDGPADRPVRWVDGRVYLDRYWRDEQVVRREIDARLMEFLPVDADALHTALDRCFPPTGAQVPDDDRQRLAAATAASARLTILTGGPGTGKTTTVARLVAVVQEAAGPGLRVAFCAPTGKAAARLQEAVDTELARIGATSPELPVTASTIHRLLGWRPDSSTRFRHDAARRLPHDVVVVDEASMVSLPLLARVLEALRPDARLVLVGDPDQLASVEVGAVLGDLVARVPDVGGPGSSRGGHGGGGHGGVVRLTVPHRYGRELGALAEAIRHGDADRTLALLRAGDEHVSFVETDADAAGDHWRSDPSDDGLTALRADVMEAGAALVTAASAGDATTALEALGRHRLLLAHRRGPAGVTRWAALAQGWVADATGVREAGPWPVGRPALGRHRLLLAHRRGPAGVTRWAALAQGWVADATGVREAGPWPVGRPLLVTANDRTTGLSNGDTGVVLDDGAGGVVVAFGEPSAPRLVRPHRLPAVEPVHAMTVHRAQGSQFSHVSVVLPPATSPLLTRELLYTAVTRAQELVRVVGSADAVRAAVERPVRRASGLRFDR